MSSIPPPGPPPPQEPNWGPAPQAAQRVQPGAPPQQWGPAPQANQQWGPAPQANQQWGPAPQGPPPVPAPAGLDLMGHFKRAATWRLERLQPVPSEVVQLAGAGIHDPLVQSYAAWRRSALMIAAPMVLLTAALAIWGFSDVETGEPFNSLGAFVQVLPLLGPIALAAGLLVALNRWIHVKSSNQMLMVCWVLSVVFPLLPALLPLEWLLTIDRDTIANQGGDIVAFDMEMQTTKAFLGLSYAVSLLPMIVTLPAGVVRGSQRTKGLLPDAALPGFFLITTAPFYSLLVLVALVLIMQILGTGLLLVGALLLAGAPWVYVFRREHYLGTASTIESSQELDKAQKLTGVITLAGLVAVVLWALTSEVQGRHVVGAEGEAWFDYLTVGRSIAEIIARGLLTTVVFVHIFLSLTLSAWRSSVAMRNHPTTAQSDARNVALSQVVADPTAK